MRIVLLGAPGSGKGTQKTVIEKRLGIPSISVGDILRENVARGTDLGLVVKKYMVHGDLVPDNLVVEIVKERIKEPDCRCGYILDGFPRTLAQAEALEEAGEHIDLVLNIEVSDDEIVERLSNRRYCKVCGEVYNLKTRPTRKPGVCDKCGGELVLRPDDEPNTVRNRLKVYREQTKPLIRFYRDRGVLRVVDGTQPIEQVSKQILRIIDNSKKIWGK
ncbi:MAG: adenylate kinase [Methanobacteriota archaeon]|nr:MAG: adenylate kinase [Euryarchaeota archaeon]